MRILVDEDSQARDLLDALTRAGHDISTISTLSIEGANDPEVLEAAHRERRVLLTQNARDFRQLHDAGQEHAGIILIYPDIANKRPPVAKIVSALDKLAPYFQSGDIQSVNDWF